MTRKLVSFTSPHDWETSSTYHIGFAYYDKNNRYNGISEDAKLTEKQIYDIFKPYLIKKRRGDNAYQV